MNWSAPEFAEIAALVTAEFGIAFPPARRTFAEHAVRRAMAQARERSLTAYHEHLAAEPALLRALIAEMTVGETYFFRDGAQFESISALVLPDIARRRGDGAQLRVWSAGCSTGEEAYSLAILLDEAGLLQRTALIGSDVSSAAIEVARQGDYGAWSFRHDTAARRQRCFVRSGKRWSVAPAYRRVDFAVHNLMQAAPASMSAGGFDLIVCRNVLLYFDRTTVERAAQLLFAALAPGGWLVTSPTDPPLPGDLGLETVLTPAGLVFRKPVLAELVAAPPPRRHAPAPQPLRHAQTPTAPAIARPRLSADDYVARALILLDTGLPHQAAAAARRALFLDRSLALAHVTLARALRLTGSRSAAQRALRHGAVLLEAHAPDDVVRGAGGTSAGTLSAVVAAEFNLLVGGRS